MTFIVGSLLLIFVLFVIIYPFLSSTSGRRRVCNGQVALSDSVPRERMYEEIRGLRLDRDLRRISEKEYEHYLQRLRSDAAMSVRDAKQLEEKNTVSDIMGGGTLEGHGKRATAQEGELEDKDSS